LLKFAGPVAKPGDMGVWVYKAGYNTAAAGIYFRVCPVSNLERGRRADSDNFPIANGHGPILNDPQRPQGITALWPLTRNHTQLPGRMNE
jgi:hypothetical protein